MLRGDCMTSCEGVHVSVVNLLAATAPRYPQPGPWRQFGTRAARGTRVGRWFYSCIRATPVTEKRCEDRGVCRTVHAAHGALGLVEQCNGHGGLLYDDVLRSRRRSPCAEYTQPAAQLPDIPFPLQKCVIKESRTAQRLKALAKEARRLNRARTAAVCGTHP